jgi:transglutaminase-like putative cysteine protease
LSGVKDKSLFITSDRQRYTIKRRGRALLVVRMEDLSDLEVPEIPLSKASFSTELEPTIFIQSDAPEIIAKARAIVGDERDALKVSNALVKWVYENLTKRFCASFSNAIDVLKAGGGDCTEHSALYVALARAVGLPAREVSGIVYSGEGGGFYYHQWAEAFVGKWIAVDPTFGQFQADATHIEFASGDLLSQAKLINLVGNLKIKISEYSYEPNN